MTGYRRQLIIGIDPGTTTGYAILGTDGRMITADSSKKLSFEAVLRETTAEGKPLLVGTDRRKCPEMVSRYAARTGAIKVVPGYDVSEREKSEMTRGLGKDAHQKDAIAAALVAYRQHEALLKRVERTLAKEKKLEFSEEVKNIVLTKRISIKKALARAEKLTLVTTH